MLIRSSLTWWMLALSIGAHGASPVRFATVKERLKEKLVCTTGCTEEQTGGIQMKLLAGEFSPTVLNGLNADSDVFVNIGTYSFTGKLGDDPHYQPGDTQATLTNVNMTPSGGTRIIARVKVSWKNGFVTAQVKTLRPPTNSAAASDLVGSTPGPVSTAADVYVQLNSSTGTVYISYLDVRLDGKLTRKTKNVNGTNYDLDSISIAGTQFQKP